MKNKIKNKQGSAILATIMVLGVVLVTALSVAFVTIQNFKASKGAARSITTYQLADEGVEAVMYEITKGDFDTVGELSDCQGNGKIGSSALGYEVSLFDRDDNAIDCDVDGDLPISDVKKLKSVGTLEGQSQRSVNAFVPIACNDETDDEYAKLLLHLDGGDDGDSFVDATGEHTVTGHGEAKITRDEKMFCRSAYFDGDEDYLTVPDSDDWDLGTDDFTIDFWAYHRKLIGAKREDYLGRHNADESDYRSIILRRNLDGTLRLRFGSGTEYTFDSSSSETISSRVWHHIAVVRSDDTLYAFLDGTELTMSNTEDFTTDIQGSTDLLIGARYLDGHAGYDFKGYMDEIRISKGVARWTEDFDVPEYPY